MATVQIDQAKVEAFTEKVMADVAGASAAQIAYIGDKLGLFADLARHGAGTPTEVAARTKLNERYVREWLGGMYAAGYLTYDPQTGAFELPAEHVPVLADENGLSSMTPAFENAFAASPEVYEHIWDAFRSGGGASQHTHGPVAQHVIDRFTAPWHEHLLLGEWIPAMPSVEAALERGVEVADVGCGQGRALIKLAKAFPASRFVGYDIYEPAVEIAASRAKEAGVEDRVRFECRDVSKGLDETYDVISTFDVVHDSVDPAGLIAAIRQAVRPGGAYVCVDINCSDRVEENTGPLATLLYAASLTYCMTVSLAEGGAGLGTLGLHEKKLTELATAAGFSSVRRLPIENPFNNVYEIR